MTKEEEAIERLNKLKSRNILYGNRAGMIIEDFKTLQNDIETVLNMLKQKDKEIDCLKNHIHYKICPNCKKEFRTKRSDTKYCKECSIKINYQNSYKNMTEEQRAKRREQSKMSMRRLRERRKSEE